MRGGWRWALVGPASVGLAVAFPGTGAWGQEALRNGAEIRGVLTPEDPLDEDGYVHDLFLLDGGDAARVVVILESPDFDAFLEWGRLAGGTFRPLASVDDSPGLPSETDARLWLAPGGGGWGAVRVTSLGGGPDGAYRLRMERRPAAEARPPVPLAYGDRVEGHLDEGDALIEARFRDVFSLQGRAGERLLAGLEADFFGRLELFPPGSDPGEPPLADEGSFGPGDAFLEVDLTEDGEYLLVVTSSEQEPGAYLLDVWSAPALVPEPSGGAAPATAAPSDAEVARLMGVAFTEEERDGLRYDGDWVSNEAVGFRFPSPGADFLPDPELVLQMGMDPAQLDATAPNVWAWGLQDALETAMVMVLAIRVPGPVTEELFTFMAENFGERLRQGMGPAAAEVTLREMDWEGARSYEVSFRVTSGEEEGTGDFRCAASGEDRSPGLILCLLGGSEDGWSFLETFRGLEIR